MAPKSSSASSATRKKAAAKKLAKAQANDGVANNADASNADATPKKKQRGEKKKKKKDEVKVKRYIAPTKPKGQIDPVDLYGVGTGDLLPAEVILDWRKLSKKDSTTIARALDELEAWVRQTVKDQQELLIVTVLPVWVRNTPLIILKQDSCFSCVDPSLSETLDACIKADSSFHSNTTEPDHLSKTVYRTFRAPIARLSREHRFLGLLGMLCVRHRSSRPHDRETELGRTRSVFLVRAGRPSG